MEAFPLYQADCSAAPQRGEWRTNVGGCRNGSQEEGREESC